MKTTLLIASTLLSAVLAAGCASAPAAGVQPHTVQGFKLVDDGALLPTSGARAAASPPQERSDRAYHEHIGMAHSQHPEVSRAAR